MSTITVTNIKATGETASRSVSGVAAAWVNFNGTGTVAINDSYNISSLSDSGTGTYSISLDVDMASASYGITTGNSNTTTNNGNSTYYSAVAGSFGFRTFRGQDGSTADGVDNTATTCGDLS